MLMVAPVSSSVLYLPFEATEHVLVLASSCAAVGAAFGVMVAAWADAAIRGSDTTPRVRSARRSRRTGGLQMRLTIVKMLANRWCGLIYDPRLVPSTARAERGGMNSGGAPAGTARVDGGPVRGC